jgi:hypothetical protein
MNSGFVLKSIECPRHKGPCYFMRWGERRSRNLLTKKLEPVDRWIRRKEDAHVCLTMQTAKDMRDLIILRAKRRGRLNNDFIIEATTRLSKPTKA